MKSVMELFKGDAVKFFGIDERIVASASSNATEMTHVSVHKKIKDWLFETESGSFLHFEFQSAYSIKDLARFMVSDAIQ